MSVTVSTLIADLEDARARTLALVEGLDGAQLMGPRLPIVNPLLWEIGHLAWFHEHWILRHLDHRPPILPDADRLYDSSAVPHDTRWDLPLPSLDDTLGYLRRVQEALIERLHARGVDEQSAYFYELTIFHEDMHTEAFAYMRQTLGYPAPAFARTTREPAPSGALAGDIELPGGRFPLGAEADGVFVFDNEKWAHEVAIAPFRIARAPVTNAEYARFVEDGGYRRRELWDDIGWAWRAQAGLSAPVHWRRGDGGWESRWFDRWRPLAPDRPVVHVSWHEAGAYCRYAGRRLPTEAEWEYAASVESPHGEPVRGKRRYPWGEEAPEAARANLGAASGGYVDVAALPAGDSAGGCRQMLGNVWEWTASTFLPYPGFVPDPYEDYSKPWFGTRKVLRGGSWVTPARLVRNTWRNFYTPERNDVYAGFRTCAR
ncbi:hypothetical protein SVA_1069 [Sulfurifustis variabilis]|uniref:Ergothioneine biosynthesis protein EgtB n=1 Tax=Sulfurifustis variabilis TaxID=1675686 RepID=A0A1B4V296_9GAMM|nr:selenoneine synthase SenA [Sulfurifustis variabilis]BAU47648.1 hypothetical protein SVA_1069 [Sulfurifustis variabilis]